MNKHPKLPRQQSKSPLITLSPPYRNNAYILPPYKRCRFCDTRFLPVVKGRHRKYCSDICKMKAYRQRKRKEI